MMRTDGNTEDGERGLLPYPVIIAANKSDLEAVKIIVRQYRNYIATLSTQKLRDGRDNTYYGIDRDIRDCLHSKFVRAILSSKV